MASKRDVAMGERFRLLRGTMSQKEFGERIGVSRSYVNSVERGLKPSLEYVVTVAKLCGSSLDWLLLGFDSDESLEVRGDMEFQLMVKRLQSFMCQDNADIRGWAKVQFRRAFGEGTDGEVPLWPAKVAEEKNKYGN